MSNFRLNTLDRANAQVLAELVVDPDTTETLRVQILNKLLEGREGQTFFQTMFEELLSFGECPHCEHKNHWAIPEDDLNQMGWVTNEQDSRVIERTTKKDCNVFQEACKKKKITT